MNERERLSSRLGFIMLSAGCAIGCGNVWKFPWMCGQNGGGSFMLLYILCLLVLGLPVMVMEFAVGRAAQASEPAQMVLFFASDLASFVNGEIGDCDGGIVLDG